jgi:hypothetical protein
MVHVRKKKRSGKFRVSRAAFLAVVLLIIILQMLWLGRLLDRAFKENIILQLDGRSSRHFNESLPSLRSDVRKEQRYLIVRHVQTGQGTGNVMSGLLAAHLLGEEFDRIVCVAKEYTAFHQAFETLDENCKADFLESALVTHPPTLNNTITLNNYQPPPSDCWLRGRLASNDPQYSVLYYVGNTYPKWPIIPNELLFHRFYQPKPALLPFLPWASSQDQPPSVVVHLRLEDGILDARAGLDNVTLHTLGEELLHQSVFLVTNNVVWYQFFEDKYAWSHPAWSVVEHSALGGIQWGAQRQQHARHDAKLSQSFKSLQTMQMWADWYTILKAQKVYHTNSDFSLSAIRWNHKATSDYTIQGVLYEDNEKERTVPSSILGTPKLLLHEDYEPDLAAPRLIDRDSSTLDPKNCQFHEVSATAAGQSPEDSAAALARKLQLARAMVVRRRVEYQMPMSATDQALLLARQQLQQTTR